MIVNKFIKNVAVVALSIISCCSSFGQNETTEESTSVVNRLGLENLRLVPEMNSEFQKASSTSIFIQQIGSNNRSTVIDQSTDRHLKLVQNGNDNHSDISVAGKSIVHNVLQNGDNNFLLEYGNSPTLNLERHILQNGDGHGLVIYGSNSLTDKMILNQQGGSKTITIRNFN